LIVIYNYKDYDAMINFGTRNTQDHKTFIFSTQNWKGGRNDFPYKVSIVWGGLCLTLFLYILRKKEKGFKTDEFDRS
jgi:hypothetical protein